MGDRTSLLVGLVLACICAAFVIARMVVDDPFGGVPCECLEHTVGAP